MKLQIYETYEEMSEAAARLLSAQIRIKPDCVIGLATGSTPQGLYKELIRMHKEEGLDFSEVEIINLDEYIGLGPDHENSYSHYMKDLLFSHINIDPRRTHIPYGLANDPEYEAELFEESCNNLEIDIQLLGVGPNGHIGFNEPAEFFTAPSHVVELTDSTIQANKRFFEREEDVPRKAITLGMKQILRARKILMLANGEKKASALKALIEGDVTPQVPVSILNLHGDVIIMADEEAAKLI